MKNYKPIGRLLCEVNQNLRNRVEKLLSPFDLTGEQFHLLNSVDLDVGRSQSMLCEIVMKTPANLTRILDRLEKKGLIERKANPEDRRSYLVYRTKAGDELFNSVSILLNDFGDEIEKGISKEDIDIFIHVINKINENLFILPQFHGEKDEKAE